MKMQGYVSVSSLIRQFEHGCRTLFHMNWNSVPLLPVSVASVLGIGGFLLVIRDGKAENFSSLQWSSEGDRDSEKVCLVPGLQNLGNNCFLNVILQALSSSSYFRRYLQKILNECKSLAVEDLLLTVTLASLLEELCMIRDRNMVLSPWKVMSAMDHYIPNFNLTNQQDAAEAFLHLLSSLREEFAECYVPNCCSLADASAFPNCRILTPNRKEDKSGQRRWHQHFLGPFDGLLGSILTCQSCSFQIMMDFEFFHSLSLSPMLGFGGTIMAGCTMEDCLKKFIVDEQVENYRCNHCWHNAAVKYLSSLDGSEADIGKLKSCSEQDSCDCRNIPQLEALPWSNKFSRTFKQLSITRCPKILCIHLQRASMNQFGELVKLQGHISFPLILNLSPFMNRGVEIKNWEDKFQRRESEPLHYRQLFPHLDHINTKFDTRMLSSIYGENTHVQAFHEETSLPSTLNDKVSRNTCMYSLVSVVEHFGRAGSGHYMVYRRIRAESDNEDQEKSSRPDIEGWVCISDSKVFSVSERDVLAAEASMLFYERFTEGF